MLIKDLQKAAHELAIAKGWYDEPRTIGELIALCHSELSEALEAFRDSKIDMYIAENGKPEGLEAELADTVIRIMDMAAYLRLNLTKAIEIKMAYNKSRPRRWGGKKL